MTGLLRRRTVLTRPELKPSYDVVIVGGGVNGLSLAHNLAAHHGITNVAVLDASYIGSGGSGRNTQVVRANYNTPETVPLYKASLAIWRTLSQELDFNLLFSTQGELDLCHTHDSLEVERDKSLLNRAYGVQTDILTPAEIAKANPLVDLSGGGELPVVGASFHPPGSFARHDAVVWGYATSATRRGVHVHEQTRVTGIDVVDGECRGVATERGPVSAGLVVNAAAGWSSLVAQMAGVRLPIVTHPLQAFVTEPYRHVLDGLLSSMDLYVYVSQTARGELLVGAEILPYNTYATRSTFGFLAEAAKRTIQIFPVIASARAMRQWAGLCDMTPDSSPLLGESEVSRFFLMAGMGTWGFKGSPIFGTLLAERIATGRMPELIAPFAPDRFRSDRMVPDAASAGTH
jgi:sarcosine oxidase subunit beta